MRAEAARLRTVAREGRADAREALTPQLEARRIAIATTGTADALPPISPALTLLFTTRPAAYAENPAFLAKLALIAVGLLNVVILRLNPRWTEIGNGRQAPIAVRAAAFTSLVVWLGAVLAGRWIGFLQ